MILSDVRRTFEVRRTFDMIALYHASAMAWLMCVNCLVKVRLRTRLRKLRSVAYYKLSLTTNKIAPNGIRGESFLFYFIAR